VQDVVFVVFSSVAQVYERKVRATVRYRSFVRATKLCHVKRRVICLSAGRSCTIQDYQNACIRICRTNFGRGRDFRAFRVALTLNGTYFSNLFLGNSTSRPEFKKYIHIYILYISTDKLNVKKVRMLCQHLKRFARALKDKKKSDKYTFVTRVCVDNGI